MSEDMPNRMSDRMPEDMPDRMPEEMSEDMPDRMSDRMPEDMPDRMPEDMPGDMPEHMPEDMPDRMPDRMPDKMPEDLPVRKCINVMVGITRSKVIFSEEVQSSFQTNIKPSFSHTVFLSKHQIPTFWICLCFWCNRVKRISWSAIFNLQWI